LTTGEFVTANIAWQRLALLWFRRQVIVSLLGAPGLFIPKQNYSTSRVPLIPQIMSKQLQ